MTPLGSPAPAAHRRPAGRRRHRLAGGLALMTASTLVVLAGTTGSASSSSHGVGLGTAASFAVLAASTVTNTGPTVVRGDLGVAPGSAVTGFPPGQVLEGQIHAADAAAQQAQADLTVAYNDAAGRVRNTTVSADLGGQTFFAGVHGADTTLGLTGTVTLDAQGDPAAVFIFQAGSALTTASSSRVLLINQANPCNVFWQLGSSATLGTSTDFVGTVLAQGSATLNTGATVTGRVLARGGAVTLDTNTVTRPACAAAVPTPGPTTGTPSPTDTTSPTPTDTTSPTPTANPSASPPATSGPTPTPTTTPAGGVTGGPATPDGPAVTGGRPVVPVGSPATGFGGTASSGTDVLAATGVLALLTAGLAGAMATRRPVVAKHRAR